MHSVNFQQIRLWHKLGYWDNTKVYKSVWAGLITAEEYKEITGKDYK